MSVDHAVYRMPTPSAVAAVVAACQPHSAEERWGDRLGRPMLYRLERQGRRPGRVDGLRIPREPGERLRCTVDPDWDGSSDLTPERASDLTGVPAPAFRERMH